MAYSTSLYIQLIKPMIHHIVTLPEILDGEDKSSDLKNKIRKNYKQLRKWAKRSNTNCFRLYDKQVPDFPLAIDYYDGRFCIHYFPRGKDPLEPSLELTQILNEALHSLFHVSPSSIFWRTRTKHKTTRQYEKIAKTQEFFPVIEYGVQFYVNLQDYLDTGLFLDHRETRQIAANLSKNKSVLNLFAYTSAFSVHAAMNGAYTTKSIDLSNTYTEWSEENFRLNQLSLTKNTIIRADCMQFLKEEIKTDHRYDVVIIDPPTISRSKKMQQLFDVQVDYIFLIQSALKLLNAEGVIIFSTNLRKFVFDHSLFKNCQITEISHQTLPIDFHDPKIHRCWKIVNQ